MTFIMGLTKKGLVRPEPVLFSGAVTGGAQPTEITGLRPLRGADMNSSIPDFRPGCLKQWLTSTRTTWL